MTGLELGFGLTTLLAAAWGGFEHQRSRARLAESQRLSEAARTASQASEAAAAHAASEIYRLDSLNQSLIQTKARVEQALDAAELRCHRAEEALARANSSLSELTERQSLARRALAESNAERDRAIRAREDVELQLERAQATARDAASLKERLERSEEALRRARAETERTPSRATFVRMQELDRKIEELVAASDSWMRRAEAAEAELARRDQARGEDAVTSERDTLRARVEALEEAARRTVLDRGALKVLGIPNLPRDAGIFQLERRAATDACLRETYLAAQAAAAIIVDRRGSAWARFGNTPIVERLGAAAVLLTGHDAAAALGRPAQLVSETFGVYGRHFVRLPGMPGDAPLALGVTGSRECPALPLRLASLRLTGARLEAEEAPVELVDPAIDSALSAKLSAWTTRRRAQAAAAFSSTEVSASQAHFAAAVAPLVPTVRALFVRAQRDGFAEGFSVVWRRDDDVTVAARALHDGETVVFARFDAPPAARVLDDLVAAVRWSPPATPRLLHTSPAAA